MNTREVGALIQQKTGCTATWKKGRLLTRCPAHPDKTPSLSVSEGRDGRVLLKCFAGCSTDEICASVGLTLADLMPDPISRLPPKQKPVKGRVVATYRYTDEQGKLLHEVQRMEPKSFLQRRPDPLNPSARIRNMDGVRRVPYRLPETLAAIARGETVFIVEGEKDAANLAKWDLPVTCNAGGAEKWTDKHTQALGIANFVIIPDNDPAGLRHFVSVARSLVNAGCTVRRLDLPSELNGRLVKDLSDWQSAGGSRENFLALVKQAMAEPACTLVSLEEDVPEEPPSSDEEENVLPPIVSIEHFMAHPLPLRPMLIEGCLRRGHKLNLSGGSKTSKTWALLQLCLAIGTGTRWFGLRCHPGKVLYMNLELDDASCQDRIQELQKATGLTMVGVDLWNLRGYCKPLSILIEEIKRRVCGAGYAAIVIDPIYKLMDGDENSNSDMAKFMNHLDDLVRETVAAIIMASHFAKGMQGGKSAIDRTAGAGVFGRDPDAILTMTEVQSDHDLPPGLGEPLQLEGTLRHFPRLPARKLFFRYPIHVMDDQGLLANAKIPGSSGRPAKLSPNQLEAALLSGCPEGKSMSLANLADRFGVNQKTLRRKLEKMPGWQVLDGNVSKAEPACAVP